MSELRYETPKTAQEAVMLMTASHGAGRILAGGTDLLNQLHKEKCKAQIIVQLKKVKDLHNQIQIGNDGILIGALATLSDIADNKVVQERFFAIAEGALQVGSKQIRNKATLVGNICNASPAADTVPPLLLFEAIVNIAGLEAKKRSVPLSSLIVAPGSTVLKPDEIVESVFVPYPPQPSASTYAKLARREGVDLAIVGVAGYADIHGGVRVALGAVGPVAFRAHRAETVFAKSFHAMTDKRMSEGSYEAMIQATPISDIRATKEYRLAMVNALTQKTVQKVICAAKALKG